MLSTSDTELNLIIVFSFFVHKHLGKDRKERGREVEERERNIQNKNFKKTQKLVDSLLLFSEYTLYTHML